MLVSSAALFDDDGEDELADVASTMACNAGVYFSQHAVSQFLAKMDIATLMKFWLSLFDHMQAADTTSQLINYSLSLLHDDLTFQYSILRMLLHVTVPKSLQEVA